MIGTRVPTLHNGSVAKRQSVFAKALHAILPSGTKPAFIAVSTAAGRWSDALSFPVDAARGLSDNDAVIVECKVRVLEGRLGIGLTAADGSTFVSHERTVPADPAAGTLRIWTGEPARGAPPRPG